MVPGCVQSLHVALVQLLTAGTEGAIKFATPSYERGVSGGDDGGRRCRRQAGTKVGREGDGAGLRVKE